MGHYPSRLPDWPEEVVEEWLRCDLTRIDSRLLALFFESRRGVVPIHAAGWITHIVEGCHVPAREQCWAFRPM